MEHNTKILTRGQASCLALSMCPTDNNRKIAKDIVNASPFEVVYLKDYNPLVPVAIGKNARSLNPFLYCSYPETPPPERLYYDEEDRIIKESDKADIAVAQEKRLVPVSPPELLQRPLNTIESDNENTEKSQKPMQNTVHNTDCVIEYMEHSPNNCIASNSRSTHINTDYPDENRRVPLGKANNQLGPRKITQSADVPPSKVVKKTNCLRGSAGTSLKRSASKSSPHSADTISSKTPKKILFKSTQSSSAKVAKETVIQQKNAPLSDANSNVRSTNQINPKNNAEDGVASRKEILNFIRKVLVVDKPDSPHFELQFVTSAVQLQIVKDSLNIGSLNQQNLARLVNRADIFSYCISFQGEKGRWLYVMKKQYRDRHTIY